MWPKMTEAAKEQYLFSFLENKKGVIGQKERISLAISREFWVMFLLHHFQKLFLQDIVYNKMSQNAILMWLHILSVFVILKESAKYAHLGLSTPQNS